jgi:ribosome-associated translation inhibitor RaiA
MIEIRVGRDAISDKNLYDHVVDEVNKMRSLLPPNARISVDLKRIASDLYSAKMGARLHRDSIFAKELGSDLLGTFRQAQGKVLSQINRKKGKKKPKKESIRSVETPVPSAL